jgi:hypothetical protein
MTIKLAKMKPSVEVFDIVWSQDLIRLIGVTIYINQEEHILVGCHIKNDSVYIEYGKPMGSTLAIRLNRDTPILIKIEGNN